MCTVIVAIIILILTIVQLPTKLACWVNLALLSPISIISILLYMSGPVVTFCPTKVFWTKSTKIIYFSGVPESNLGMLITYFPKIISPRVLWHVWSIYSHGSKSYFAERSRDIIGLTNSQDCFLFLGGYNPPFWLFCFILQSAEKKRYYVLCWT